MTLATTDAYGIEFTYPSGDVIIGPTLRQFGEFGRIEVDLANRFAAGGAFIDVGANVGAISVPVSRTASKVLAIEAHPGLAALLRLNVRAAGATNVDVKHLAASSQDGQADFPCPPLSERRNFGNVGFGLASADMQRIETRRLDGLAPDDTRMVKVDVQGHELHVLAGATQLLTSVRPVWIIEVAADRPNERKVIQGMQARGYRCYWLFSPFATPLAPKRAPDAEMIFGDINILAVPTEREQPADMQAVDLAQGWPQGIHNFPYLGRYGFDLT